MKRRSLNDRMGTVIIAILLAFSAWVIFFSR